MAATLQFIELLASMLLQVSDLGLAHPADAWVSRFMEPLAPFGDLRVEAAIDMDATGLQDRQISLCGELFGAVTFLTHDGVLPVVGTRDVRKIHRLADRF